MRSFSKCKIFILMRVELNLVGLLGIIKLISLFLLRPSNITSYFNNSSLYVNILELLVVRNINSSFLTDLC